MDIQLGLLERALPLRDRLGDLEPIETLNIWKLLAKSLISFRINYTPLLLRADPLRRDAALPLRERLGEREPT